MTTKISRIFKEAAKTIFTGHYVCCCDAILDGNFGSYEEKREAHAFFKSLYDQNYEDRDLVDERRNSDDNAFMEHRSEHYGHPKVRQRRVDAMLFCSAAFAYEERKRTRRKR